MAVKFGPFQRLIKIVVELGIYMESGFLNLLSSGECTEDAYKPAILNYDAETTAYVSGTDTPLQGRVSIDRTENESITAVHDAEAATANGIDTTFSVVVTNIGETVQYSSGVDYTVSATGITALSTGGIANGQTLWVDYTPDNDEAPFTGQALVSGSESLAVGCANKLPSITDPCDNTYTSGGYCDASIFAKKNVQYKVPSSMFSGKLRLLVQAIYGSARTDYGIANNFDLQIGDTSPFTLFRGWSNSNWLYTTANYDYFICTFTGTAIEFRAVVLSSAGEQFRDILKTHPRNTEFAFVTRVEAYILSTATIGAIHSTVAIAGDTIYGSPLDYGWHANWDGSEASVVCFYKDPLNPQYLSDQHQLTVGESWNGSAYTFTVSSTRLISDALWWPWTNGLQVFYYDEIVQSMMPIDYPDPTPGGYEGTFDAPIYCYYTLDTATGASQLQTVRIYMDRAQPANVNYTNTGNVTTHESHAYAETINFSGPEGEKGFKTSQGDIVETEIFRSYELVNEVIKTQEPTINTASYTVWGMFGTGDQISLGSDTTATAWATTNGVTIGALEDYEGTTVQVRFMHYHFLWTRKQTTYPSGRQKSAHLFAQTVLGDCGAVVIGRSVETSTSGGSESGRTNLNRRWGGNLYKTGGAVVNPWMGATYIDLGDIPGPLLVPEGYSDGVLLPNSSTFTNSIPSDPGTSTIDLFYNINGALLSATIIEPNNLSEYFGPTISDKETHTIDTGRRSIGNKYKIDHDAFAKDGGFLNDSSTGWQ